MNGKGKRMATLMAKKLPMTHKWVCLEWQRRDVFFCNDRVFSLCILVPTREPSWTEAWIGSCTQLVQKKWEWAVKLAARSQPWIDWAKEKGLLTQLGCDPIHHVPDFRVFGVWLCFCYWQLLFVVCGKDCCFQHSRWGGKIDHWLTGQRHKYNGMVKKINSVTTDIRNSLKTVTIVMSQPLILGRRVNLCQRPSSCAKSGVPYGDCISLCFNMIIC